MSAPLNNRPETWRDRLVSYAAVTAIATLVWLWASNQTRHVAEANMRLLIVPESPETQAVGPPEPLAVRVQFTGSKVAVDHAVDAVNGKTLSVKTGTCGIPNSVGGYELTLADVIEQIPAVESTGASVRSTQPSFTTIAIDSRGK
jgi:hypothetical protein